MKLAKVEVGLKILQIIYQMIVDILWMECTRVTLHREPQNAPETFPTPRIIYGKSIAQIRDNLPKSTIHVIHINS